VQAGGFPNAVVIRPEGGDFDNPYLALYRLVPCQATRQQRPGHRQVLGTFRADSAARPLPARG